MVLRRPASFRFGLEFNRAACLRFGGANTSFFFTSLFGNFTFEALLRLVPVVADFVATNFIGIAVATPLAIVFRSDFMLDVFNLEVRLGR
jgi:hypothetical protein